MNILALTTSSPVLSIALATKDGSIKESKAEGFLSHAEKLLPMTDELLKGASLNIREIDCFLIDRGPGSFTGLRIGFATLKGVGVLRTPEFWGALSLDLIAQNIPAIKGRTLAVCLDAHRDKFYVKKYVGHARGWEAEGAPEILSHEEAIASLPPETLISGDALGRYVKKFENAPKKFDLRKSEEWYPRASALLSLYRKQASEGSPFRRLETPKDFIPWYFRKSEAEERLEERM